MVVNVTDLGTIKINGATEMETVKVSVDYRWPRRWMRFARLIARVLGDRLAVRLAMWGIPKFGRYRVAGGAWKPLPRPSRVEFSHAR